MTGALVRAPVAIRTVNNKKIAKTVPVSSVPNTNLRPSTHGLPDNMTTTVRYRTRVELNPAAGALSTYVFRANSIYDPDYTSTGHQPLGYDQLSALYNHYTVLSSTIKASFGGTFGTSAYCGLITTDQSSTVIPSYALAENPSSTCMYLEGGPSSSQKLPSISNSFNAKKFFGVNDPVDAINDLGAPMGSNAYYAAYFIVFLQAADFTTDLAAISVLVDIEYKVVLSSKLTLTAS